MSLDATCPVCATPIEPKPKGMPGRPRVYCSPLCKNRGIASRYSRARSAVVQAARAVSRPCAHCATPFTPKPGNGAMPIYCSKRCNGLNQSRKKSLARAEIRDRTRPRCEGCAASMVGKAPQARFCTSLCGDYARGTLLPPLPMLVCALDDCDVEFRPNRRGVRACSERHGQKLWNRESRADGRQKAAPWDDRRREHYHRRRALKAGASTGVPVVFAEIAARDEWLCGLCGGEVRADTPWPEPLSPSLDHIVPLKVGPQNPVAGTHDPSNVQLAHLRCNTAKGNRIAPLLLTG